MAVPPSNLNPNIYVSSAYSSSGLILWEEYLGMGFAGVMLNGTSDPWMKLDDWYTHNANDTVWTFNIKPGATWSDGTPITSEDVIATYGPNMCFNPAYDILSLGPMIKSEYALNSSAVVFVLKEPTPQWYTYISAETIGCVPWPAKIVNEYGPAYPNLGTNIVDGPFYTYDYKAGDMQMILYRNPYYTPQPHFCQININFVESLSQTATSLLSGSTDMAMVEYTDAKTILNDPNLQLLDEKGMFPLTLEYNVTVYPYNMTEFRQALAFGIDQSQIAKLAYAGYAQTAYDGEGTVAAQSGSEWFNPNIMQYSFDQAKSLQLLNSIGISKGSDGMLHYPNGNVASLTIWTATDTASNVIAAESMKSDLSRLGFNVEIEGTSESNLIGDYASNVNNIATTGIILAAHTASNWGFFLTDVLPGWDVYFTPALPNISWEWPASVQKEYDSNMSAIDATDNNTKIKQYVYNIEAINAQNLPTIVLAYPDVLYAFNTQRWTGWPTDGQLIQYGGTTWNPHAWVNIMPVNSSSTFTTQISTQSSQAQTPSGNSGYLIAAAVAVAIIIIGGIAYSSRRRKKVT